MKYIVIVLFMLLFSCKQVMTEVVKVDSLPKGSQIIRVDESGCSYFKLGSRYYACYLQKTQFGGKQVNGQVFCIFEVDKEIAVKEE
jgi:hypothetical protein